MPYQRKGANTKTTTVTVDRTLYDEVISRGYLFSDLCNAALKAVLDIDDEQIIRYEVIGKMHDRVRQEAAARRMQEEEEKKDAEAEEKHGDDLKRKVRLVWDGIKKEKRDNIAIAYAEERETSSRDWWEATTAQTLRALGVSDANAAEIARSVATNR